MVAAQARGDHAGRERLGNEIERIRQLEGALCAAAFEIALLIADVGDYGVAFALDFLALPGLERLDGRGCVVVGPRIEPGPALETRCLQVPDGHSALAMPAAGDEENRNLLALQVIEESQRRRDRRSNGHVDPFVETTGFVR